MIFLLKHHSRPIKIIVILLLIYTYSPQVKCQRINGLQLGIGLNYRTYLGYNLMASANIKVSKSLNIVNYFFLGTHFIKPLNYISEKWSNPNVLATYSRDSIIINRFYFINYSPSYVRRFKFISLQVGPSFTLRTQSRGGNFSANTGIEESKFPSYSGYNYGLPGIKALSLGIQTGFNIHLNARVSVGMYAFIEPGNIAKSNVYGTQKSTSSRLSFLFKYHFKTHK